MAQMGCCEEKKCQFHCSHCSRKTMCRVIFVMRSFVLPLLHCGLYNNLFLDRILCFATVRGENKHRLKEHWGGQVDTAEGDILFGCN